MCGIFAYYGTRPPEPELLHRAAAGAAQRGPHAHGWAGTGIEDHRAQGPMDPLAAAAVPALQLVGHARLVTSGRRDDPAGVQPIRADGHLLVHNGTVTDPSRLAHSTGLDSFPSDSALLARLYADLRTKGLTRNEAMDELVDQSAMTRYVIVVLDADGSLVASRRGLPLHRLTTAPTDLYLSSGQISDGSEMVPAGTAHLWSL